MPDINPESVSMTVASGAGAWLFFKKFLVKNAEENTALSASDAYCDVIDTLRNEVRRLSEVNTELASALNDLQRENIKLKREISQLHDTLNDMNDRLGIIKLRSDDLPAKSGVDRRRRD